MKPFSGGQLLSEKTSPFGKALTTYQCIIYALDKPGTVPHRGVVRRFFSFDAPAPQARCVRILPQPFFHQFVFGAQKGYLRQRSLQI